jgi:hypothetical protein
MTALMALVEDNRRIISLVENVLDVVMRNMGGNVVRSAR